MPCQCEHQSHFDGNPGHEYLDVQAGSQRAQHVGPICDECAATHMKEWLV